MPCFAWLFSIMICASDHPTPSSVQKNLTSYQHPRFSFASNDSSDHPSRSGITAKHLSDHPSPSGIASGRADHPPSRSSIASSRADHHPSRLAFLPNRTTYHHPRSSCTASRLILCVTETFSITNHPVFSAIKLISL